MSQYVTFTLGDHLYGVDVARVQEVLRAQARARVPLAPEVVSGLVNLRGQVVLTIDLRTRLGLAARPGDTEPMMVVAQVDGEPVSMLVDEIGDVLDLGAGTFEAPPETLPAALRGLVVGAHKLTDRLLLVLDVDEAVAA